MPLPIEAGKYSIQIGQGFSRVICHAPGRPKTKELKWGEPENGTVETKGRLNGRNKRMEMG
jgi:hypothetical protein